MPSISAFFGVVITMYFNDHSPPHFHAGMESSRQYMPSRSWTSCGFIYRGALTAWWWSWALDHRPELRANWNRARDQVPLNEIEPLD